MKERPILFSGPMVRAILDGRKTMTRRIVTVPWKGSRRAMPYEPYFVESDGQLLVDCSEADDSHGNGDYREFTTCMPMRYGSVGDLLWVRETFSVLEPRAALEQDRAVIYQADGDRPVPIKWRPSIHMPRWASRITLEITDVRVERLHEMPWEDAKAEGMPDPLYVKPGVDPLEAYMLQFRMLWDDINAKRAPWDSNPWVWVVSFRPTHGRGEGE